MPLEDPTFWDGAVSGIQDDVMPILKVISSVPISLTFSQRCQFRLFFHSSMSWHGSGISRLGSHNLSPPLYKRGGLATSPTLFNTVYMQLPFKIFFPPLLLLVLSLYLVWSVHRMYLSTALPGKVLTSYTLMRSKPLLKKPQT